MKNSVKWIIGVLCLVILIAGASFLYTRLGNEYGGMLAGDGTQSGDETSSVAAPDFTVYDEEGNSVSFSDMSGKPVVINFWASWCPPCKSEMPDFEKMYKKYGDEVQFMMINLTDGYQETEEAARAHIAETGYTFPVFYDTDISAATVYGVSSIPMTFFASAEGNLVTYAMGMIDGDTLERGIGMIK